MSNVHIRFVEDSNGDLTDIVYYHGSCAPLSVKDWPAPEALDYVVYCYGCEEIIDTIPLTSAGLDYALEMIEEHDSPALRRLIINSTLGMLQ